MNSGRVNPLPNRIPQSKSMHIMPWGQIVTDPFTFSYFRISEGSTFDLDSSSVVRSLIGLFIFRNNPVSKVYQHRSGYSGSSLIGGEFEIEQ